MKTIVVTGASGGIGQAIVRILSGQFHIIAIVHSTSDSNIFEGFASVKTHSADVTQPDSLRLLATEIGPIDWIICAHGMIDAETELEKQTSANIEDTFRVNIISLLYIAQTFLAQLKTGMVFIGSTSGISANGRYMAYSASKAGVNSLAQALARNRERQIFISLCPGPTLTEMRERIGAAGGQDPLLVAQTVARIVTRSGEYKSGDVISLYDGIEETVSRL